MSELEPALRLIHDRLIQTFEQYVLDYNAQEIGVPDRLRLRAQGILGCPTMEAAEKLAKKLGDRGQEFYLGEWAKGTIVGRITVRTSEKLAKSAESLADLLDSKGEPEQAEQQRQRAKKLRESLTPGPEGE